MNEFLQTQPLIWENLDCQISKIKGREVVTLITADQAYREVTETVVDRAQEAASAIEELSLFNPETVVPPFTLRVAVLPRKQFEPVLFKNLKNPQDWAWAQVCVRKVNGDYFVVYDSSIATQLWQSSSTMPVDQLRENIHEISHPYYSNGLNPGLRDGVATNNITHHEMVVELIPRVLLGLQSRMPESTKFLLDLQTDQVLPLGTINEKGWGCFPPKPLRENPMYGAIFLAGLATVDILGHGNLQQGIINMIRTAQRCNNFEHFYDEIEKSGVKKEWLLKTIDPIEKGQDILRQNFVL